MKSGTKKSSLHVLLLKQTIEVLTNSSGFAQFAQSIVVVLTSFRIQFIWQSQCHGLSSKYNSLMRTKSSYKFLSKCVRLLPRKFRLFKRFGSAREVGNVDNSLLLRSKILTFER